MSALTKTYIRVLNMLAVGEEPMTRQEIGAAARTLTAMAEAGLVVAHQVITVKPEEEGGTEEISYTYTISEAGRAAIAPDPEEEQETGPQPTQSRTLVRCLEILSDGKWHSYTELHTSSQNVGRLVDRGLAVLHVGEDRVKRLQITEKGRAELAYNQPLY